MIHYVDGDITTVEKGIIVHGVNCQGVMASGVAKAIRDKWPQVFTDYKRFCDVRKEFNLVSQLGMISFVEIVPKELYVVNAFTQEYYGRNKERYVSYDAIDLCFRCIVRQRMHVDQYQSLPICFPKIGAGLGGGNWKVIEAIIEDNLNKYILDGFCYELS